MAIEKVEDILRDCFPKEMVPEEEMTEINNLFEKLRDLALLHTTLENCGEQFTPMQFSMLAGQRVFVIDFLDSKSSNDLLLSRLGNWFMSEIHELQCDICKTKLTKLEREKREEAQAGQHPIVIQLKALGLDPEAVIKKLEKSVHVIGDDKAAGIRVLLESMLQKPMEMIAAFSDCVISEPTKPH